LVYGADVTTGGHIYLDDIEAYLTREDERLTAEQQDTDAWRAYTGTHSE
jgi:hypothetical protein